MNSFQLGVRVTALALAFVLPTTALAGPPEAVVPEGPVAPPPLDDRALLKKKASPGIAMASVGFTVFLGSYLATQLFVDFEGHSKADVEAYAVPIVGPFIAASRVGAPSVSTEGNDVVANGGGFVAALPGLFQLAGFAVGVAGIALIGKAVRKHRRQTLSLGGGGVTLRF